MSDKPMLSPTGRHHDGRAIRVWYDASRCTDVGACVQGAPAVFDLAARPEPLIHPDAADPAHIAEVIRRCPTGALHYRLADGPDEPADVPTRITMRPEGAIWVRGDLTLDTPAGPVAERRIALCGCGRTENRPHCDGVCTRVAR